MGSARNNHHCRCESGDPGLTWSDTHKFLSYLNENHSAVLTRQIPRLCSELRSARFAVSHPDRLTRPLNENAYSNGRLIFDEILSSGGEQATCHRLAQVFRNIGEISAAEYICNSAPVVAAVAAENPRQGVGAVSHGRKRNRGAFCALKVAGVALGIVLIPLLVYGGIWLFHHPEARPVPADPPATTTTSLPPTKIPRSPHPTQEPHHIPKNSTKSPLISRKMGPLISVNISNARILPARNCHKSYNFTYNLRLDPEWDSAFQHIRGCTGRHTDLWDVVTVTGIGTVRAFTNIIQSSSRTVGSLRIQKLTLQQQKQDSQTCAGSLAPITFPALTDLEFRNLTVSTATCAAQGLVHAECPVLERISITEQDLTVHSVEAYRELITKAMESGTFKVLEIRGVRSDDDPDRLAILTDEMCRKLPPDFKIDIGSWTWSLAPDYQLVVRNIWAHPTCRRRFLPNLT